MDRGKSYTANARGVYASNNKIEKKVEKLKLAARSDTAIFANILLLTRRQLKHRGIFLIKPGDKDWLDLKTACVLATEFCNEFQMSAKMGYKKYLDIALPMMKNFSLFKFKSMHPSICNKYEATQIIEQDKTPQQTKDCHDIYLANISERIGYSQGYESIPEKYRYFIEAKQEAKKFGVSNKVYITAQFAGFEWANTVPDPAQLVGTKALDRLQKYAYENNIKLGSKEKPKVNFKKIKRKK